jgi:hypothetical protein
MSQHLVDELLVSPLGIVEAKFLVGGTFLARRARTGMSMAATNSLSLSLEGGVFRYSMTVGSTPPWRIMASVLRQVPQSGL